MKVLITGGAGYIGTELTIALDKCKSIDEIIIYDNLARRNYNLFLHSGIKRGKVKFIEGELLDSRKLDKIVSEVDTVVHLGARVESRLINASHHLYEQINNWGTAETVYAAEKSGNVKKFIYGSSIAVYGDAKEPVNKNTEPYPRTYYGSSKLRGEQHVRRLFDKMQTAIVRIGNVYGFGTSFRKDPVINLFMFEASFKGRIKINGTGLQKRGFISLEKTVDVLKNMIIKDLSSGIYDLVEHNFAVMEVADYIRNEKIYPDTEMIFVNQHLKLRNIEVTPDPDIKPFMTVEKDFLTELQEFKRKLEHSDKNA